LKQQARQVRWLGGYVRWGKRGPAYIIERWVDGQRFHVSTKCRTERAALEQLAAFEADPAAYKPRRKQRRAAPVSSRPKVVTLTAALVHEYLEWMVTRPTPSTHDHQRDHHQVLRHWLAFYAGRDVRDVPLSELAAHLDGKRNQMMRVQGLRSFCAWLRQHKYLLTRAEDPTLDLRRPRGRATKDTRRVAIPPEHILAVLPHLPAPSRDVMVLRLGTGWHMEEVRRFAEGGEIVRVEGRSVALATIEGPVRVPLLAVLRVRHKVRATTNTPVLYPEHLAAAERIRAAGHVVTAHTLNDHTRDACAAAKVPRFYNWHIRHSAVSYAMEHGALLEQASVFVDHLNVDTTRTHYADLALPTRAVPVLRVPAVLPAPKDS